MPLPEYLDYDGAEYGFVVPAQTRDQVFLYRPALKHPDGTIEQIPQYYGVPAYDFAACGRPIAVRGYLRGNPADADDLRIEPCADDCGTWVCYALFDFSALEPAEYLAYWNTSVVVEIEGWSTADGMSQTHCLVVTGVAAAPAGVCGVVPATAGSWGGLKAAYR
jgi:hypothetical protein